MWAFPKGHLLLQSQQERLYYPLWVVRSYARNHGTTYTNHTNHTHPATFAVSYWLEGSHRSCWCSKGRAQSHEHEEVAHGTTRKSVLHTNISSLSSYGIWLIFLVFLCSSSRKRRSQLIPWHLATSYIPASGGVGHLSGSICLVQGWGHMTAWLGRAMTGSLVHKVRWGHTQQHGSVVRSCPAPVKDPGNSTPKAWKKQRGFLYFPSFAYSLYLRSREKKKARGKEGSLWNWIQLHFRQIKGNVTLQSRKLPWGMLHSKSKVD